MRRSVGSGMPFRRVILGAVASPDTQRMPEYFSRHRFLLPFMGKNKKGSLISDHNVSGALDQRINRKKYQLVAGNFFFCYYLPS